MTKISPSAIDAHIGKRLALRRTQIGKTLANVSKVLGVSFQQMQKYEKGINKLSGANLYMIAKYLGVDINYFFANLSVKHTNANAYLELREEKNNKEPNIVLSEHEFTSLLDGYSKIKDSSVRKNLTKLIKSISG